MHILFFSHYYPPEVNAPASRTSEHCRAWHNDGHEITVVTCAPNHPAGIVYSGYRNGLWKVETIDGIRVIRLWTFVAANQGFLLRTLNYLSYLFSVLVALPWLPRVDLVVSTSPQFFCGLAGLFARRAKGAPWVLEIRDLWPESIVSVGAMRRGLIVRCLERLEVLAYLWADRIVAVTDSFVPHIASRGGDPKRIAVVKNGVDLDLFDDRGDAVDLKRALGLQGKFVAAYVGTHGMAHGLETVLEAATLLRDDPRIAFLLVGDGAERAALLRAKADSKLPNVVMLGQQPKAAMPQIWQAADASLILLRRNDTFKSVIPSKMVEAMAMRRPVILGVEGEARRILEEAGAGLAITPESATELAAAVVRLAGDTTLARRLGERGRAHVEAQFDRRVLAKQYLEILERTFSEHRAGHSAGRQQRFASPAR
jgi:glycosyltransferase involved in cell wall biosynthesis